MMPSQSRGLVILVSLAGLFIPGGLVILGSLFVILSIVCIVDLVCLTYPGRTGKPAGAQEMGKEIPKQAGPKIDTNGKMVKPTSTLKYVKMVNGKTCRAKKMVKC